MPPAFWTIPSRTFFDHKKMTGQLLWMDMALAWLDFPARSYGTTTITGSSEFAPLRKLFRGSTHQLECLYTGKPDSLRPQGRMLSLCDQIHTDVDSNTGAVTSSATSTPDNRSPTVSNTTVDEPRTDEATTPTMYMPPPHTVSDRPITDRQDQPYTTYRPWNMAIFGSDVTDG